MVVGTVCFVTIPGPMLRVFSQNIRVIEIGRVGFHFVGMNFLPLVTSLTFPAVGSSLKSSLLTVIRTEVLFVLPPGLSLLPLRPELVLADLPGHGAGDDGRGPRLLPLLPQSAALNRRPRRIRLRRGAF